MQYKTKYHSHKFTEIIVIVAITIISLCVIGILADMILADKYNMSGIIIGKKFTPERSTIRYYSEDNIQKGTIPAEYKLIVNEEETKLIVNEEETKLIVTVETSQTIFHSVNEKEKINYVRKVGQITGIDYGRSKY